eukprot:TRINITY_DN15888_c0_g1_i1.p1 TRINITY_DN15888_c0_g1~~TRINITY_DN15888_c0_g1_i1.p1  ORF type:complete len:455 (-),score=148.35 TRINITY_DN15888_c0_g1_i1:185-1381(-)
MDYESSVLTFSHPGVTYEEYIRIYIDRSKRERRIFKDEEKKVFTYWCFCGLVRHSSQFFASHAKVCPVYKACTNEPRSPNDPIFEASEEPLLEEPGSSLSPYINSRIKEEPDTAVITASITHTQGDIDPELDLGFSSTLMPGDLIDFSTSLVGEDITPLNAIQMLGQEHQRQHLSEGNPPMEDWDPTCETQGLLSGEESFNLESPNTFSSLGGTTPVDLFMDSSEECTDYHYTIEISPYCTPKSKFYQECNQPIQTTGDGSCDGGDVDGVLKNAQRSFGSCSQKTKSPNQTKQTVNHIQPQSIYPLQPLQHQQQQKQQQKQQQQHQQKQQQHQQQSQKKQQSHQYQHHSLQQPQQQQLQKQLQLQPQQPEHLSNQQQHRRLQQQQKQKQYLRQQHQLL